MMANQVRIAWPIAGQAQRLHPGIRSISMNIVKLVYMKRGQPSKP